MELLIRALQDQAADAAAAEVVERKGLGHPDTICDALAEEVCRALCRFYLRHFGTILHHNVDKVLLVGGSAEPAFGGGRVLEPIEIFLAGRAACEVAGERLPVPELAMETARTWLRQNLHALDADRHVRVQPRLRPGSAELVDLGQRSTARGVLPANDTSCGVGFAPETRLERAVLAADAALQQAIRGAHPEFGEDVKVMGVRRGDAVHLTVACAMVGSHLGGIGDYLAAKEELRAVVLEAASASAGGEVAVEVNAADDPGRRSVYLTVTGTSAEAGDDGEAGRGNRGNGLITPYRPMTLESVAGKNPVTHVGKLYSRVARSISEALVRELDGVEEATCHLVSRIGHPIDDPSLADVRLRVARSTSLKALRPRAEALVHEALRALPQLWKEDLGEPR